MARGRLPYLLGRNLSYAGLFVWLCFALGMVWLAQVSNIGAAELLLALLACLPFVLAAAAATVLLTRSYRR